MWPAGETLRFAIANVASAQTQAVSDQSVLVDPAGFDSLPIEVGAPLSLIAAPKQCVPAIVNLNFAPNTGRMIGRLRVLESLGLPAKRSCAVR